VDGCFVSGVIDDRWCSGVSVSPDGHSSGAHMVMNIRRPPLSEERALDRYGEPYGNPSYGGSIQESSFCHGHLPPTEELTKSLKMIDKSASHLVGGAGGGCPHDQPAGVGVEGLPPILVGMSTGVKFVIRMAFFEFDSYPCFSMTFRQE
jgi:hypothetical protein